MESSLAKYNYTTNSDAVNDDDHTVVDSKLSPLQTVLKTFFGIPIENSGIDKLYNCLFAPNQQLNVLQFGNTNLLNLKNHLQNSKFVCFHENERVDNETLVLNVVGNRLATGNLKSFNNKFNVIIDTHGEDFISSLSFLLNMYESLLYGGYYIIENLNVVSTYKWNNILQDFRIFEGSEYYIVPIPTNKISLCNNVFIMCKLPLNKNTE